MEPVDPRPVGEAGIREGRRDPPGDRRLGAAPALPAARRHRLPPVLRLVSRRGARPRSVRREHPQDGPIRVEFGAQAVPTDAEFCQPERWPDLDWDELVERYGLQKWVFDERVPPGRYETFAEWAAATQAYQATLLRFHIETLRRLKYRPTGGFCLFSLADAQPAVSWSVLDHERHPKAGFFTRRRGVPAGDRRGRADARRVGARRDGRPSTCTWSAICAARSRTPRSTPVSSGTAASTAGVSAVASTPMHACGSGMVRFVVPAATGELVTQLDARWRRRRRHQPLHGHDLGSLTRLADESLVAASSARAAGASRPMGAGADVPPPLWHWSVGSGPHRPVAERHPPDHVSHRVSVSASAGPGLNRQPAPLSWSMPIAAAINSVRSAGTRIRQ